MAEKLFLHGIAPVQQALLHQNRACRELFVKDLKLTTVTGYLRNDILLTKIQYYSIMFIANSCSAIHRIERTGSSTLRRVC